MQRIPSFSIDHTKLLRGMYISRIDDDVITYDIRMKEPNKGDYLSVPALHTFEHLFATYARSSRFQNGVLYIGPMGCRTGFYLLTRGLSHQEAIDLVRESLAFIAAYEGEIPGAKEPECGNYLEHSLTDARVEAVKMIPVLINWTEADLAYKAYLD